MATLTTESTEGNTRPVPQVIAHEVVRPRETKRWVDWVTTTITRRSGSCTWSSRSSSSAWAASRR